jgi:integrase
MTKTGAERTVDLSAHLVGVLKVAIAGRKAGRRRAKVVSLSGEPRADARPQGPWLFYPELGAVPTRQDTWRVTKSAQRAMTQALESAGLPGHFTLHGLRHTFGSGLVSRGYSLAYVQQQMGHASIRQTVDCYGSWLPVRVPGAVDALSAATAPEGLGHFLDTKPASGGEKRRKAAK